MDVQGWLSSAKSIEKSKKGYAHFDYRTNISLPECRNYISDPQKVAAHGFYPFIHYQQKMTKYNKKKGKKIKVRDICYAAHIDRCIYQLYSAMLNEAYNLRVERDEISAAAVAYRTNLFESNIHFAKRAFNFIRLHAPCHIMIGDFTGFFDNLNHNYLKTRWCDLIGETYLPTDHYAVFKNITKYSIWELTDLLQLNELKNTMSDHRKLNKKALVLTHEQFKINRSQIAPNPDSYGIPQGSPISALLANIYMLEIDKQINDLVSSLNGMYMRYSDDFIIILPGLEEAAAIQEITYIIDLLNHTPGLTLESSKTQYFYYDSLAVSNCGQAFHASADCKNRFINFLGFTFDGRQVSIRAKTTSKYYYRMRRKAKTIAGRGGHSPRGKHISGKELYEKYSIRGAHGKKGNYLSYVERAQLVFGENELIGRDTRRHMQKIRQALQPRKLRNPNPPVT